MWFYNGKKSGINNKSYKKMSSNNSNIKKKLAKFTSYYNI